MSVSQQTVMLQIAFFGYACTRTGQISSTEILL